ncbi:sarcosine oxidase subunit delta [Devosia sp. SL43]|uniref:sarcosine oxidase subunit delta n=1 Tax=Devosia sp. SL43 TaxID=2806348 RepID=UPI001F1996EF|nr:sarcosine oxidase subunit delta family protein [Devosia sp. SL43]UJW87311.1 sarcosine oxidase subunit delta family protein [Devosia sp. SL43]
MASLLSCPHCGTRPREEFTVRGDATLIRPAADAPQSEWEAYVFLRDNPRGWHKEHWHHTGGCRRWLVVERHTVSHAIRSVVDAGMRA